MIIVIIAGGSGTRLWPLSTPGYPKHLLALTGRRSLLQHTYRRAKTISNEIFVLTEASHAMHVKNQLPELKENSFIIEPARRGTASCIVAALCQIRRSKSKEPIAFLHADHYIRDTAGFAHTFKVAKDVAKQTNHIVLIGVEPDYPSVGFGYIKKDGLFDAKSLVYKVNSFTEKPPFETARKYVQSGDYLWNCGYFVGTLAAFEDVMRTKAKELFTEYERLCSAKTPEDYNRVYLEMKNEAIDYALMEKLDNLLVVPASFDWMDLGSYNDIHRAVDSDSQGNHITGEKVEIEDVQNTFIHDAENNKPIVVIGLDNIAVVNTSDGILITRKDMAQKVGKVSKRINLKDKE